MQLVMRNFNLNKEYSDLNSTPADYDAGHLPVLSSENILISTEEHNDAQPTGGPTLIEVSVIFPCTCIKEVRFLCCTGINSI